MEFRIADTFTASLARLTAAFDLQLNPANPGTQLHRIDKSKDRNFWSARISRDLRLIVHRTDSSLLLCYADHHDAAYQWAERRMIERHPRTGAAQIVEVRETVREIEVPRYVAGDLTVAEPAPPPAANPQLLDHVTDDDLLGYGVPPEWLAEARAATEDTLFELADHLPGEAAEALLELATGGTPTPPVHADEDTDPFDHPDAQRRFRLMENADELEAAKRLALDLDGDLVIVGWGLAHLAPPDGVWNHGHGYAWQRTEVHGRRVVYLGFLHSIWGDVAGRVVTRLAELGARDVVYVGKVGALNPDIEPNTRLATGNTSLVGSSVVTWPDFFGDFATAQPGVHTGVHVTSPSILLENRDWLTEHAEHAEHAFVDPEIGPMGVAARDAGIDFGYLHVISNNLARHYPADLSNERHSDVVRRRTILIGQIQDIITNRLAARPI